VGGDPVNWIDENGNVKSCPKGDGCKEKDQGGFPDDPFRKGEEVSGGGNPSLGGGKGGGGTGDSNLDKVANTLWRALDVAMKKLNSEKCAKLFANGTGPDPRQVLHSLVWGTSSYGNFVVDDIIDKPGQVTSATVRVTGTRTIDAGFGATQIVNGRVQVTINVLAGDFVDGNVNESAATLLHELGHVYDLLSNFLGGSIIVKDGNDVKLSQQNQALIKKECF